MDLTVSGKRICIVTSGHVTSCPRMLKAADAAAAAGWRVHVVAASSRSDQRAMDATLLQRSAWALTHVEWGRDRRPLVWWHTRVRHAAARALARALGSRAPSGVLGRATSRAYCELVSAAASIDADLYYGGAGGGTLVAAAAARATGRRYAIDFEDLHSGEAPAASSHAALWREVERRLITDATFVTAGSAAIAAAYAARSGRDVVPIHNTFPLPALPPPIAVDSERVRFYWIGQTIGPGRGIEAVIDALAESRLPARVSLRGNAYPSFVSSLQARLADGGDVLLECLPFAPPEQIVESCANHDVGLAFETGDTENSRVLLSNKALTYLLAGVAPLLSETPGNTELLSDLGREAIAAPPGDRPALVERLRGLADRERLARARHAAWQAGVRRWHWEHPDHRGRLLNLIGAALS